VTLSTVTWRQAVAAIAATLLTLFALVVVVRSDGLPAVDASSARATAWFVHQPTGRVVLVDGYGGRALASLDAGNRGQQLSVAEGRPGAFLLNDTTAEARAIDSVELRLGTPFGLTALGDGRAVSGVGQAGLVVFNPDEDEANVVPADGEPIPFRAEGGTTAQVAPDGSIWSLVEGDLVRTTSSATQRTPLGVDDAALLSLVGNAPLVVDVSNRRARLGDGAWRPLATEADPSEILVQVPGPPAECGWVGADDDLWCVSAAGIEETSSVPGLDLGGGDLLAIAGEAAAVVRRGPSSIVRFDWRTGDILDDLSADVRADASLGVTATVDLVWVDDVAGDFVWGVNPWSVQAIEKGAQGILVLGEDGDVVGSGDPGEGTTGADESAAREPEVRSPDDNGIDDPPVAVDDRVTARSGASVPVQVTVNDYDPDGEAIAVSSVGVPGHGSVDIGTATTVVYTPEPGYVGVDRFEYTIVDGAGNSASATVTIELLAPGSTNKPPVGVVDSAETGPGVPVIVDVLLNDVDPERDALRLGGFSPPQSVGQATLGEVTETIGPSGLSALRFAPTDGFEGTAVFTYRPVDSLGAVGDDVEVRVEVARLGDPNRPPLVRPDAVRLRRDVTTQVPVLANDSDPDGDRLMLAVVEPVPAGLDVTVEGEELAVTARAGAGALVPFTYSVDDGNGHVVRGSVLVAVIDDVEPNRPPVVTADTQKAVVGQAVVVDVTANDVDPDGDPLTVVSVTQPADGSGQAVVFDREKIQFSPAPLLDEEGQATARFTYTVSDGNGHEVVGDVTITVLPEPLDEPPFARDDSTFTYVDVPVTIDVLRNDGDPSGGRPTIVGRPGCATGGRATVTADLQVRYDPPPGRAGAFRCTYEVTNAQGLKASASIIVSVREPELTNVPPVAALDSLTVEVGATARIDVLANDRDPDGPNSELRLVSSTAPLLGTATRDGRVITFVAGNRTGNATINYQVADGEGAISLGRLRITITERANQAPIAVPDAATIFGPATPQQFDVLANDSDPDETPGGLSVVSATRVSGDAAVSLVGSVVTIAPNADFIGQVIATYTIRDGEGLTATSSVVLTVQEPLNRPPDARDDVIDVVNGGSVTVPVLLNDSDPDGDALSVSIVSSADPALGATSLTADKSITFAARPGASGTALVEYQVSDGELTDTAVLRIEVRPCAESSPIANDGFLTTGYRQPIAVDLTAFGANGTIADVTGPPGFVNGVYTPPEGENGNVVIAYSVVNSCRLRASGRVTIDVNQEPVAVPKSITVFRGEPVVVPVAGLATDSEPLTISAITGPPSWVSRQPDRLLVSPTLDTALGVSQFTVTVTDPGGLSTVVAIAVTVQNRPPIATADTVDATDGRKLVVDLVANDTDADSGGVLVISELLPTTLSFSGGGAGSVTLQADDRSVRIDPGDGRGVATFTYRVRDVEGADSSSTTVTVHGPPANQPPVATDQAVSVSVGTSVVVDLQASDPDGPPPSIVEATFSDPSGVVERPRGLRLSILATTPGTFIVTYQVTDGEATSPTATLTITASSPTTTTTTTTTSSRTSTTTAATTPA
jgi:large repetitive protein